MAKKNKKGSSTVSPVDATPVGNIIVDMPLPTSYQTSDDVAIPVLIDHKSDAHDDHSYHGHSHGDANHGHSHGRHSPSPSSRLLAKSPRATSAPREDMCAHLVTQTTECGHQECMSDDEKKAYSAKRVLISASLFCLFFMICELVGGYISNSLAIISDAFHLLTDVLSFLISIVSLNFSRRAISSNSPFSYGYHRIEVIGALLSILFIYLLTGVLLYEAIERIRVPQEVDGKTMFIVAVLGLCVNIAMGVILLSSGHGHSHGIGGGLHSHSHGEDDHGHAHGEDDHGHSHGHGDEHGHGKAYASESSSLLHDSQSSYDVAHGHEHGRARARSASHDGHGHGHKWSPLAILDRVMGNSTDNINVRAAFIHVVGDALQSIGVMFAAALIWWKPEYTIADPICTFVFSIIVLTTTWRILREGILVLMEGVPAGLDPRTITTSLKALRGVETVHDLHVWALSVGHPALSVHVLVGEDVDAARVLRDVQEMLKTKYGITHITVQIEHDGADLGCHGPKRACVREPVSV